MALPQLLIPLTHQSPEPEDVTAGWVGAVVLVALAVAVVFLGFSLVKQLRKAQAAEDAGVYGHDELPADDGATDAPTYAEDSEGQETGGADSNGDPHRTA